MNSKFTNDLANKLKNGVQQPTVPKQQAPVVEAKYEPPKIRDPFLEGFYEEELKAGLISEDKLYVKPNEAPMLEEHYKVPMPQIKPLQYPEIDYNALLQSVRAELKLTPPVQTNNNATVWDHEAFLKGFNSVDVDNVPTQENTLTSKTSDSIFRREEPAFTWQEQVSNKLSETVRDEAFLEGFLGDEYEEYKVHEQSDNHSQKGFTPIQIIAWRTASAATMHSDIAQVTANAYARVERGEMSLAHAEDIVALYSWCRVDEVRSGIDATARTALIISETGWASTSQSLQAPNNLYNIRIGDTWLEYATEEEAHNDFAYRVFHLPRYQYNYMMYRINGENSTNATLRALYNGNWDPVSIYTQGIEDEELAAEAFIKGFYEDYIIPWGLPT